MSKVKCDRCFSNMHTHIMSWFNEDIICMDCSVRESERPDFTKAKEAELNAVKSGNFNFKGSGLSTAEHE